MKTKNGKETNGDYIKFKIEVSGSWCVETEKEIEYFQREDQADLFISSIMHAIKQKKINIFCQKSI